MVKTGKIVRAGLEKSVNVSLVCSCGKLVDAVLT